MLRFQFSGEISVRVLRSDTISMSLQCVVRVSDISLDDQRESGQLNVCPQQLENV